MRPALSVFFGLASALAGEEAQHAIVPVAAGRPVSLTAISIEREGAYPSVIRLKGAVEIKSQVCLPVGKAHKLICDGYTLLRADSATYVEATGEIKAEGAVSFTPLKHESAARKR